MNVRILSGFLEPYFMVKKIFQKFKDFFTSVRGQVLPPYFGGKTALRRCILRNFFRFFKNVKGSEKLEKLKNPILVKQFVHAIDVYCNIVTKIKSSLQDWNLRFPTIPYMIKVFRENYVPSVVLCSWFSF